MSKHPGPVEVVDAYFRAMRGGPDEGPTLFALFHDDAVYVEPFGGQTRTHRGRAAIESAIRGSWEHAPPDLTLEVDRVDVDGEIVVSEWTCRSPAWDGPMRGRDRCTVQHGRIRRLEVEFLGGPA